MAWIRELRLEGVPPSLNNDALSELVYLLPCHQWRSACDTVRKGFGTTKDSLFIHLPVFRNEHANVDHGKIRNNNGARPLFVRHIRNLRVGTFVNGGEMLGRFRAWDMNRRTLNQ